MKLLTLNAHSWLENNCEEKIKIILDAIIENKFDIIALQEVNQRINSKIVDYKNMAMEKYVECTDDVVIKEDNFALILVDKLKKRGIDYFWSFVPNHIGYDIFDEGLAILSLKKICETNQFYISKIRDYRNYRTRRVLGIKTLDGKKGTWYFSIHMGWWNDSEDPFKEQWSKIKDCLQRYFNDDIYLLGDFNSPSDINDEGYAYIKKDNIFNDTYICARVKDSGYTVKKEIDGWRESGKKSIRIDYIFKNNNKPVEFSRVIFNGKYYNEVSDHFGVYVNISD